jgi:replicative superfamily II helicase
VPRTEVVSLLANTYAGYLFARRDPAWSLRTATELEELVAQMLDLGLLEEEGENIQLTLLGRACGRSALSFESALRLVDVLRIVGAQGLSAEDIMALVQMLPESDGGYTPLMRKGNAERVRVQQARDRFGDAICRMLQRYAKDDWDWIARCKRAAILADWIEGVPVEAIERTYSPNVYQGTVTLGDVTKFADATRYHLRSAHQIATILLMTGGPTDDDIDRLLRRLQVGIPEDALDLLTIPVTLDRGSYLALRAAGIREPADLGARNAEDVARLLGAGPTARLIGAGVVRPTSGARDGQAARVAELVSDAS